MAADALADALAERQPGVEVRRADALLFMLTWFRHGYRRGYLRMVDQHPLLWRALYDVTDRHGSGIGHALTMLSGQGLQRMAVEFAPDVVVCTHFLAPEVLARAIRTGRLRAALQVVITDHDVHRMWVQPEVSHYYVASDLVRARLALRFGVPEGNVDVTGIPVRRAFSRPADRAGVLTRFGLDPSRPIVLYLSGGFSPGPMGRSIVGLWQERPDLQIVAVCGRNVRLRRRISRLDRPAGAVLRALGFVKEVRDLMAVSEVVIAKCGGMTVAECMAVGRPLVMSAAIPGQEERNAHAVLEAGAGVWAPTPEEIRWRVVRLLDDPDLHREMSGRARAFGRPHAADAIADRVAAALPEALARVGPHFHGA